MIYRKTNASATPGQRLSGFPCYRRENNGSVRMSLARVTQQTAAVCHALLPYGNQELTMGRVSKHLWAPSTGMQPEASEERRM